MPITYGRNLTQLWGTYQRYDAVLMKAATTHTEKSEVFLPYQNSDQTTALRLAAYLDSCGRHVFIDVWDDTLVPGDRRSDIDGALITAIGNADTLMIVVSDQTQLSWWVPWEIGVSTPYQKPRAMYKPRARQQLPTYLKKLPRLDNASSANLWVVRNSAFR